MVVVRAVTSSRTTEAPRQPDVADDEPMYWTIRDIEHHCRVSRATAWRLVRSDDFPTPIVLGVKTIRWRRNEVVTFVERHRDNCRYAAEMRVVRAATFVARSARRR